MCSILRGRPRDMTYLRDWVAEASRACWMPSRAAPACDRIAPPLACVDGHCVVATRPMSPDWRVYALQDRAIMLAVPREFAVHEVAGDDSHEWRFEHANVSGALELSQYGPDIESLTAGHCVDKVRLIPSDIGGAESPIAECRAFNGHRYLRLYARSVVAHDVGGYHQPVRFGIVVRCDPPGCEQALEIVRRVWVW
jgi:hypothetical protein